VSRLVVRRALAAGALWALFGAASCAGWRAGLPVAENYASIGVEIFSNESYEPDIESAVHAELTRAVRDMCDVPLEPPSEAQVIVRGRVLDYRFRGGVRSRDNQLLETGLTIVVEATLIDQRTRRPIGPPETASGSIGYPVQELDGERTARERALRHLCDELVLRLFAPQREV
jgi:hypothetical protein